MSKTKRKRYSGAFKAKVGLEALIGVKTVGQIARDYEVHPVQVTQWKGIIRDHLPELFESPQAVGEDHEPVRADGMQPRPALERGVEPVRVAVVVARHQQQRSVRRGRADDVPQLFQPGLRVRPQPVVQQIAHQGDGVE